mmetsp:Transcript_26782/g.69336  ORF Transcript_26782/g.69336 Transcript_26782/m.69336 type:complete len:202 (-) Transcript_26782:1346-1951(-)
MPPALGSCATLAEPISLSYCQRLFSSLSVCSPWIGFQPSAAKSYRIGLLHDLKILGSISCLVDVRMQFLGQSTISLANHGFGCVLCYPEREIVARLHAVRLPGVPHRQRLHTRTLKHTACTKHSWPHHPPRRARALQPDASQCKAILHISRELPINATISPSAATPMPQQGAAASVQRHMRNPQASTSAFAKKPPRCDNAQ